jgi:hypothetical protein
MKSYISRKLPLTTRNTDFTFDSFAGVACDGLDMTISKNGGRIPAADAPRIDRMLTTIR